MSERDRTALAAVSNGRTSGGYGDYRIGPDDLLDIRIPKLISAQQAAMTASATGANAAVPSLAAAPVFQQGVRVSGDGDVTLPMIGAVPAAGLTPDRARSRDRASPRGRRHPARAAGERAGGRVSQPRRRGHRQRRAPGSLPGDARRARRSPISSGWPAARAKDAGRVVEFAPGGHPGRAAATPIRLDLEVLQRDARTVAERVNPRARPGDVISVAPAGSVLVDGWVDKPGSYPVTRGLTLSGAIAAAGGHALRGRSPARDREARPRRARAERSFTVDLDAIAAGRDADLPLTDGDVVHLPASARPRRCPWGMWTVAREIDPRRRQRPALLTERWRGMTRCARTRPRSCGAAPAVAAPAHPGVRRRRVQRGARRAICATTCASSTSTAGSRRPASASTFGLDACSSRC